MRPASDGGRSVARAMVGHPARRDVSPLLGRRGRRFYAVVSSALQLGAEVPALYFSV